MKPIKFVTLCLALVIVLGCTNSDSPSEIEKFQKGNEKKDLQVVGSSNEYQESIEKVGSEIGILLASQESLDEQINYLNIQKDSIENALIQIEASIDQVESKKIAPEIKDVNAKLNELKSVKENLLEQQDLQKKEILLADKKKQIFEEEKQVYAAQHQSLWEKGAPPSDFELVDSLLANINLQINKQENRLKILNRKVADIEEQVKTIDKQRTSLGIKIRNNYNAQEIFEEYSLEEKERLEDKLMSIEEELDLLFEEQEDIHSKIARYKGEETYLQIKQSAKKEQELAEKDRVEREMMAQQELETLKNKRAQRITNAFFAIGIVALVLFFLYYMGKKRKSAKNKKSTK